VTMTKEPLPRYWLISWYDLFAVRVIEGSGWLVGEATDFGFVDGRPC